MIELTVNCKIMGTVNTMSLPLTEEELEAGQQARADGAPIQDIFPQLSADEREFLITGLLPEQFRILMGEVQ